MQLKEIFYYIIFTICMTAACALHDNHFEALSKNQLAKRTKREAAILVIDNFPGEQVTTNKPKSLYKRISRKIYHTSMPNHGPSKGKIRFLMNANTRRYNKNHKTKNNKHRYYVPSIKKRLPTSTVDYNKQRKFKAKSLKKGTKGTPYKNSLMTIFPNSRPRNPSIDYTRPEREPMGFGEPPADYQTSKFATRHRDLRDSFGLSLNEPDQRPSNTANVFDYYDMHESDTAPDYQNWNTQPVADSNVGYTNIYPTLGTPSGFGKYDFDNDFEMIAKYRKLKTKIQAKLPNKDSKTKSQDLWLLSKDNEEDDKLLVGGQYAEPPARYVPSFQSNKRLFFDSEQHSSDIHMDHETTVSPYVNYKNSNMAFSPQNLNDVFSIE